jgi:hypothetical protein
MKQRDTPSMLLNPDAMPDQEDAQIRTVSLLFEMEDRVDGNPEAAMVLGNSMIAAARLLFKRMGVDEHQQLGLYREFWKPLVDKGVEA